MNAMKTQLMLSDKVTIEMVECKISPMDIFRVPPDEILLNPISRI